MTSTATATTISTGTVSTSGTTTHVTGTSSGIDTDALVETAYAAKTAVADKIDVQIDNNKAIIAAYDTLSSLGRALETALSKLSANFGFSSTDSSVYNNKESYLTASDGSTASNYMSLTVDSTATSETYQVSITQMALAMKVSSSAQNSKTAALGLDGSFTIGLDGGSSQSISVTSSMTLSDLATTINASTSTSGIKAVIVKNSDSTYSLSLSANTTGQNIVYTTSSGDDVLQSLGIVDSSNNFANITQSAQKAIIQFDGTEITSSTNTFEDIVDGVTIDILSQPAAGVTIKTEIDYDYSGLKDAIQGFVDAYNSLRDEEITQQATDSDGVPTDTAILAKDSAFKNMVTSIYSDLTGSYGEGDYTSLASIGITFDENNKLVVDDTIINDAILNHYSNVQSLFQTSVTTNSSSLSILRDSSNAGDMDFQLDITMNDDGTIASASVDGNGDLFTVNGTRLIGNSGTIYEGLTFAYVGTSDLSTNVKIAAGLANELNNTVDANTNSSTGIFATNTSILKDADTQLTDKVDRIRERADSYRESLIAKYAAMEAAISSAKSLLNQINTLFGNDSSS